MFGWLSATQCNTEVRMLNGQVVVRLTEEQRRRLEWLAKQTGRTRSQLLRLLIEAAAYAGAPDVRLTEEAGDGKRAR